MVFQGGQNIKFFPKASFLALVARSDSKDFSSLLSELSSMSIRTFWKFPYDFNQSVRWFSHQQSVSEKVELSPSIWGISSCFLLLCILSPVPDTPSKSHWSHESDSLTVFTNEAGTVDTTNAVAEEDTVTVLRHVTLR